MKKTILLAAMATSIAATPALAQSAPGGLHVGALAGYEGIDVEAEDGSATANADSAVYGINAGYDIALGGAFVGVEGEISTSGGTTEFPSTFAGARDGLETDAQMVWFAMEAGLVQGPRDDEV